MEFKLSSFNHKQNSQNVLDELLKSTIYKEFKAAYNKNDLSVEEVTVTDVKYLTDDVSANADVELKIILVELDIKIKNIKEKSSYHNVGLALLSEFGGDDDVSYSVISIGDFTVPIDDAYDALEFDE